MAKDISSIGKLRVLSYLAARLLLGHGLRRQRLVFFLQLTAIALGSGAALLILVLSHSFTSVITEKLYGYFGRLWIQYYAAEQESHPRPVEKRYLASLPFRVEPAIHLPVLVEGAEQRYEGIQLLAVEKSWWEIPTWKAALKGALPSWSSEEGIILSRRLAQRLGTPVGADVVIVWFSEPPRMRRLRVVALYDAQIEEIDGRIAFAPIHLGRELLGWDTTQVQVGHLFPFSAEPYETYIESLLEKLPMLYEVLPIENVFPDIFGWLGLIQQNVHVILGIVIGLSFFVVASGFLVLQFSQRLRYEVLWVLGAVPFQLRSITFFQALLSILLGSLIGIGWSSALLWTQAKWEWFRLDPENYLLSAVPVRWNWQAYMYVIGVGVLLSIILSLLMYPKRRALRLLTQAE
ncbi:MAG: ABC transporter permease [Bacteroidia bacterium]|nr:ABC transporter permease [Bacteroidia bacterium]